MRHPQTAAEATLWRAIRNRSLTYKFRRQHPIDRFIIDFYCAQAKLCIEIDGESHLDPTQQQYDTARATYLEELGYRVIRFTNDDVRFNIHALVDEIARTIARLLPPLPERERAGVRVRNAQDQPRTLSLPQRRTGPEGPYRRE